MSQNSLVTYYLHRTKAMNWVPACLNKDKTTKV